MNILNAQEVKELISSLPAIQLVMTLGPDAFAKSHIPGSINVYDTAIAERDLPKATPIIVYCSDVACQSSYQAYQQLEQAGFQQIWRFAGGLVEWAANGYELEGTSAFNQLPKSNIS